MMMTKLVSAALVLGLTASAGMAAELTIDNFSGTGFNLEIEPGDTNPQSIDQSGVGGTINGDRNSTVTADQLGNRVFLTINDSGAGSDGIMSAGADSSSGDEGTFEVVYGEDTALNADFALSGFDKIVIQGFAADAGSVNQANVTIELTSGDGAGTATLTQQPTTTSIYDFEFAYSDFTKTGAFTFSDVDTFRLTIDGTVGGDYGALNGIVALPEPSSLLLLGLGGVLVLQRRRPA